MHQNQTTIKRHWDDPLTESMYDKRWAAAERRLIMQCLPDSGLILDAGCGEGEGTYAYAAACPQATLHGLDYSQTRLDMARARCLNMDNVRILPASDLTVPYAMPCLYDCVISTRLLINFLSWEEQRGVLDSLIEALRPGGLLLLMEGSKRGQEQLNAVRRAFGMPAIVEQWYNLFLDDDRLEDYLHGSGLTLNDRTGFGAFFLLTRGVQPRLITEQIQWNSGFNAEAASLEMQTALPLDAECSRIRLWVATKNA